MSTRRRVITIDGLAASGKSTIAQHLAKKIGFTYFSSGMLYRMVGLLFVNLNRGTIEDRALLELLNSHSFTLYRDSKGELSAVLDGEPVNDKLYSPEVSESTSQMSARKIIREWLLDKQRTIFPGENIVAEGRDMGTVVFPDADAKFFIVAEVQTRIDRRISQMIQGNMPAHEINHLKQKMEIEIVERDIRDTQRENSPTIAAKDAIKIDNSAQTLTEVVESMYDFVAKRGLIGRA